MTAAQPAPSAAPDPATADATAVAPADLLAKIASYGELGRSFVERAYYQCLAERYAAELDALRQQQTQPAAPDMAP